MLPSSSYSSFISPNKVDNLRNCVTTNTIYYAEKKRYRSSNSAKH